MLFWKIKTCRKVTPGKRAGALRPDRYRHIRIDKKYYQEHILIWCICKGEMPALLIDHENEIRDDNRIENLRLATKCQNAVNTNKWSTNTSGHKGVSFNKASKKWVSYISVNKKIKHLGTFETLQHAVSVYKNAVKTFHGEFANKKVLCA